MAKNGVNCRRRWSEKVDDVDRLSPSDSDHEVHVLAVDDSLVDRKFIERLLRISSCKVTAVDSGRRALQFLGLDEEKSCDDFDGLKVDLIITDYCMPGMTGYELLKKIKESSIFREIPVVIMSSENVLTRIDRCLEEGAEDFLVKPVKLSDVKRLKDYMFGDYTMKHVNRGINKRKSPETSDLSSSPSPPLNSSSPKSLSSSPSPPLNSSSPSPPLNSSSPKSLSSSPSPPLNSSSPKSLSSSPSPPLNSSSPPSPPLNSPSPKSLSSSPSPPLNSSSSSSSPSPPLNLSSSPKLVSSSWDSSLPCSPTCLESPTRRLKMSNSD